MEEQKLYEDFGSLYDEGKYEEALKLSDKLIEMNQSRADYFNKKGLCLDRLGRHREKLEWFDKAVNLDNKEPMYFSNKAAALVQLGEYDEAQKILDLSLKLDDKHIPTYFWEGKAFFLQSKYYKSLECFDKCLSLHPRQLNAHKYKGLNLREMNCYEDSIKEFDLEISLNPDYTDNYHEKALSLIKMEKYEEAVLELNKPISKDPNNIAFLNTKASCLIKLNKLDEALIETEKSLNKQQNNIGALKNIAEIYMKQNKSEEALNYINKVFEATSDFYQIKGLILYELKKEDEAIDCFLKSIETKENSDKQIIEKMSLIIDNYRKRIPKSELQLLKEDLDDCIKSLTEIKITNPIKVSVQSFSQINEPLDWKKINFDQSSITNYLPVHERFICKICLSLVRSPNCCQICDDIYCSECLKETLEKNNSCPNCRTNPFKENRMNIIVREIYNSIVITCPLNCGEKLVMENLQNHLPLCKRREKHHECNLCKENLKSEEEVELHKELCQEIMMQCEMCNKEFKNQVFRDHIKDSCLERLTICEKCFCVIPFKYKGQHKNYFCDLLKYFREKAFKIQRKLCDLGIF